MMKGFDIPIVLFFFRRPDKILQVIERVSLVKPEKIYLFCDEGRNNEEKKEVAECRRLVEESINWDCEVIKNYAHENRGVYESIGKGALWVFEREEYAIFLEDDNLPEITFFRYCKEMLERYKDDTRILWVCGTNYLQQYTPEDDSSYVFTKHLMPCGWASWSNKFIKMYDGDLNLAKEKLTMNRLKGKYRNKSLYRQQKYNINGTLYRLNNNKRRASWDYQMAFSVRINNVYGISPKVNLIKNIGVDERATHGGNSYRKVMTRRFCGIESYPLEFPLSHPKYVSEDILYEKKVGKIILLPLPNRIINKLIRIIKPIFKVDKYESFPEAIKERITKRK